MNRWMTIYNFIAHCIRQAARSMSSLESGRLVLLFVGAVALTFALSNHPAMALFQSPISPAGDPLLVEPPPVEPPAVEPVAPPVEPPAVEPAAPPPAEQPQLEPEAPPPVPDQPAPAPLEQLPEQPESPLAMPEAISPVFPPESTSGEASSLEPPPLPQPEPLERVIDRDEEESRNLILDRAELVDTVVVSTAYVWLCCGIMLFLFIPLVFLFLQIRGRTQLKDEYL
jgi:hypothetical protein